MPGKQKMESNAISRGQGKNINPQEKEVIYNDFPA